MYKVTGKGSYKYTCPVCGIVYLRSQMLQRWDGLLVCSYDWEPRHPLDFIRPVRDSEPLDRTAPDLVKTGTVNGSTGGWAPGWTHLTSSTGVTFPNGNYNDDTLSTLHKRYVNAQILIPYATTASCIFAQGGDTVITLPSSPVTAGTFLVQIESGIILKSAAIPAGSASLTITTAAFASQGRNILFSGQYGI